MSFLPRLLVLLWINDASSTSSPWQTVSGTGKSGFGGSTYRSQVHAFSIEARLGSPWGLALETSKNLLYIADTLNNVVRSLDLDTGLLETIAGTGDAGFAGDDGIAVEALFNMPTGLALDTANKLLYVSDTTNNRVRAVALEPGKFYQAEDATLTGVGAKNTCPSASTGASALLLGSKFCSGSTGGGYAEFLNSIEDTILFNVEATAGAGDYDLRFRYADRHSEVRSHTGLMLRLLINGQVVKNELSFKPSGQQYQAGSRSAYSWSTTSATLVSGSNSVQLQVTGHGGPSVDLLYVIPPQPTVSTVVGDGTPQLPSPDDLGTPRTAASSSLHSPTGLALDSSAQALYIADTDNGRVRRVDLTAGTVTTVAGGNTNDSPWDGVPAAAGKLFRPTGLALNSAGTYLYVSDALHNRVRRIDLTSNVLVGGTISTISGAGFNFASFQHSLRTPQGLWLDASTDVLYIADRENARIRSVDLSTGSCPSTITFPASEQQCADQTIHQANCLSLGCCYNTACLSAPSEGSGTCCHPHLREMSTLDVLDSPQGLALDDANKLLYVSQGKSHRVLRIHLDNGRCATGSSDVC